MAHTKRYVEYGLWFLVEEDGGAVTAIPADVVRFSGYLSHGNLLRTLRDYCGGDPVRCEAKLGYCARYSADGYMYATDWCGPYTTEAEAIEECERLYGEDAGEDAEGGL